MGCRASLRLRCHSDDEQNRVVLLAAAGNRRHRVTGIDGKVYLFALSGVHTAPADVGLSSSVCRNAETRHRVARGPFARAPSALHPCRPMHPTRPEPRCSVLLKGMKACLEPGGGKQSEEGAQLARQPSPASSRVRIRFQRHQDRGLFAREDQVYAEVVPDGKKATLTRQYWREGRSFQGRIRQRRCSYQVPGKAFGGWQRGVCQRSEVCQTAPFICRCKKLNGETTTGIPTDTSYG